MNASIKWLGLFLAPFCLLPACTEPNGANTTTPAATVEEAPAIAEVVDNGTYLEGMFRYMADAPLFRDCSTGEVFPVAMAGPYIEMERAYLNSGINSGTELKVAVHGRYLERPKMEGNSNEIMLVIDSFDGIPDTNDCSPKPELTGNTTAKRAVDPADNPMVVAELKNTFWKLDELYGKAVPPSAGAQDVHMVLSVEDTRVNGYAGCNRFFGQYVLDGTQLSFSAIGSTRMACPEGMDTEQSFLQALGETERMELDGQFLLLYSRDRLVARLEAVYLP